MKRTTLALIALVVLPLLVLAAASAKDIGYFLQTGATIDAGQYTLQEGVLRIDKKGSALEGLQIIIPPGSYDVPQRFTVQYKVVRKSNVPDYVLSPLISITGPREPSKGFVIVKIPCKVPDNAYPAIFFYNEKDKFTGSLPPGPKEPGYVTGMTRVFRDMVVVAQKMSRGEARGSK